VGGDTGRIRVLRRQALRPPPPGRPDGSAASTKCVLCRRTGRCPNCCGPCWSSSGMPKPPGCCTFGASRR